MAIERDKLKTHAKIRIKNRIWILFAMELIVWAIFGFIGAVFVAAAYTLVTLIAGGPLNYAFAKIYLDIVGPKNRSPKIEDMFIGFSNNNFLRTLVAQIEITVLTFLWTLLFIIPGIIKSISYSQAFFILAEHPKMEADEAIKRSMAMMEGHKMEYFILELSFIPWILLCILTFGIAAIYVLPYYNAAMTGFYYNLKGEHVKDVIEAKINETKDAIGTKIDETKDTIKNKANDIKKKAEDVKKN
ncbi:DUF975 family protein [Candidatus Saccharibacteria bacterium]|nr:DUF975 family protein [Candidatus Saccharibacteria bacterium]